nr:homeodomain-like protein [Tanacetum cinerariifolium]GEX72923.1 homeodomain-like protein [Tanacetum cinerariifolium]
MVQKRQLAEEEYNVPPKHLKLENSCQLVPSLEFPLTNSLPKPCNSGIAEAHTSKETSENQCQLESGNITTKPRTLIQPEDAYSCLLRLPPLKGIPVGPEYQANIPDWCDGYEPTNNENKFLGSTIIPTPESQSSLCSDDVVGSGRIDCLCKDQGSLRCVRQHITEARDTLKGNIGRERFLALGFDNMGEVVSCKWTEDEQLFHDVVYSNPASLGKNFWDHLEETFPSRTNQEIVSYYFNVFVLQRRAEQNRYDPTNADSDDDEWQGSETDEEEEELCRNEIEKYSLSIKDSIFDTKVYDFQEDSCTSFEFQEPETSDVKVDFRKSWVTHDFIFDPSDVGYFSFPRSKADFLPTVSMIEEVFGVDSWNFSETDSNGLS